MILLFWTARTMACCSAMVLARGFEVGGVDVARGYDLAIGLFEEGFGVGGAHHAPADDADGDAVGGGGAAPGGARQDGGGSGYLEKITAVERVGGG